MELGVVISGVTEGISCTGLPDLTCRNFRISYLALVTIDTAQIRFSEVIREHPEIVLTGPYTALTLRHDRRGVDVCGIRVVKRVIRVTTTSTRIASAR